MKLGVAKSILAVHALVLAVGMLLSTLIYLQGQGVMELTTLLTERDPFSKSSFRTSPTAA